MVCLINRGAHASTIETTVTSRRWVAAGYVLFAIWVFAAFITMYPTVGRLTLLRRTMFTSYAADLANPPWVYIVFRQRRNPLTRLFGRSPGFCALSILAVGVVSELIQKYRPQWIAGTFDPLDIVAYGSGLLVCYAIESRQLRSISRA